MYLSVEVNAIRPLGSGELALLKCSDLLINVKAWSQVKPCLKGSKATICSGCPVAALIEAQQTATGQGKLQQGHLNPI